MRKNTKKQVLSEQLQTKFYELIEAMIEAGNTAKWEGHSSNFDSENKESVENIAGYYGDLLDKINKRMVEFRYKIKEVFKD